MGVMIIRGKTIRFLPWELNINSGQSSQSNCLPRWRLLRAAPPDEPRKRRSIYLAQFTLTNLSANVRPLVLDEQRFKGRALQRSVKRARRFLGL